MVGQSKKFFDSGVFGSATQPAQTLDILSGQTYTLSFYAMCCGVMDLRVAMEYQDEHGVKHTVESAPLSDGPLYEYECLFHTFTLPAHSDTTITLMLRGQSAMGTPSRAWIDCVQLEEGVLPNRYNLLVNGDFSFDCSGRPFDWTATEDTAQADTAYVPEDMRGKPEGLTDHALRIYGDANRKKGYHQQIELAGQAGDVFLLGEWAKGFSMTDTENKKRFALHLSFLDEEGEHVETDPIPCANQLQ